MICLMEIIALCGLEVLHVSGGHRSMQRLSPGAYVATRELLRDY